LKLSTKGRYGLRAVLDLAINYNGEHISLNSIAERQNISENYLEQVFSILKKSNLVKSIKGAQGGYTLLAKPSEITVGEILRALEGNLSIIENDLDAELDSIKYCINTKVWDKINEKINNIVNNLTLEDLVNDYKTLNGILMYHI
jgi:Rrf2 family protein